MAGSTTLFWINQDVGVSGIAKSSKVQKGAIQSLVQRGRGRKRQSKTKQRTEEDVSSAEVLPIRESQSDESKQLHEQKLDLPAGIAPSVNRTERQMQEHRPLPFLTIAPSSSGSPDDPFNTASIHIDITAHGLLRYYVYYHHPAMWPDGNGGFQQSVKVIVQTAVQDQLTMFCLLTAAAARLQYVDRFEFPNVRRKEDGYTEQAVHLMRRRIGEQKGGDGVEGLKALVQCMMFLTCAESYREDFAASRMHLEAAFAVLKEQIGGVENLGDEHIEQQLAMADLFLACVEMRPCIYPCFYDPVPLDLRPHEVRELGDCQPMGEKLLATGLLGDEVQDILETYRIKSSLVTTNMTAARAFEVGQWIMKRNMVIRHRLLSSKGNDASRATLVMWTLLAMNHTGRIKTVKIMARNLMSVLSQNSDKTMDSDLKLWVLLVGYTCSLKGSEEKRWFARQVGKAGRLRILGGDMLVRELEGLQKAFLFHVPVQEPATRALIEELELLPWEGQNFGGRGGG